MKAASSLLLIGLAVWPMALMWGQEPAPAAGGRVAIFDGSRRMVTVNPSAGAPALHSLPGTHVQRVGQWGIPGRVYSRIVSAPSRARQEWAEATSYPASGDVAMLATADFNNDSFDDAAIATSRGVEIRLGKGDGILGEPSSVFTEGAVALAPADFNGDGFTDLAVGSERGVAVLYGNGRGGFPHRIDLPLTAPRHLLVLDANADSIPDLALAPREHTNPIEILLGDGQAFRVARRLHAGAAVSRLAAADFNRDGVVDIAAALAAEPRLLLFLNDEQSRSVSLPAIAESIGVLDQGATPHLTVRLAGREGVHVMANDGSAAFAEPLAAPGVLLDQATAVATDLNNDAATDRIVVTAAQQVTVQPRQAGVTSITKTHSGTWSRGDFERVFIIQVNGSGTPVITDTPPAGLTLFSMGGEGWECSLPDETTGAISCFYVGPTVTNGPFPPIYAFVNVAANAPSVMTNTVTDGNGVTATDTVILGGGGSAPDLTISKSHTGDFTAGQTHAYTITVTNIGTAATSGLVTMTEIPSSHFTVANLAGAGWSCDLPTLKCTRSDALAPGASYPPITVAVTVSTTAPSLIQNDARVDGGGDTNLNNNATFDITTVLKPDLSLTMNHNGNFQRGQVGAQFFVTVTNVGTSATVGAVSVVHTVPASLTPTALNGTGWNCTLSPLQCSRTDALAPGASYPAITLTVNVSNSAPQTVIHEAQVSGGNDTNLANNFGADLANVDRIDLSITKTHTGNFGPSARATYSITVTNSGQLPTTGTVTVTDTPPAALSNFALSGAGWTCQATPTVACTRSDVLAPGASYPVITFAADVSATPPASFTNTANVSGGGDSFAGNNTANDPTSTLGADLTITKTHTGDFARGQVGATYTITVTNQGGSATSGTVTVVDTLPAGLTATAMAGTGWTCTLSPLQCTRADSLAGGASYPVITVTVNVAATAAPDVVNSATVSGGGDSTPGNNTANDP
ncbi:MAG: DUF11 domain-containing protein, partial [Acidobacteria bacterium]|nr:DUF11 domain-containing protein [Acidobacteriota bacterium]